MAEFAGYNTEVTVSGTSTAITGEACSGSGASWQITSTSKRVLDPSVTPTWYDNGVAISSGDVSAVSYLTGAVTFTGSKTGPITVDASYLPQLPWLLAHNSELNIERDMMDAPVYGSGWNKVIAGLMRISGTGDVRENRATDLDSGGGSRDWVSVLTGGTAVVISIAYDSTLTHRFWALLQSVGAASEVASLQDFTFAFASTVITAADGTRVTPAVF